jgi:hypothetical protein
MVAQTQKLITMKGTLITDIWVNIRGEKHLAQYIVEDITLEEAKYAINHEIFTHGKWVTATNTVYL